MDPELKEKLLEHEKKLDAIHSSIERARKYALVLMWLGIIAFLVPIIGLALVIPQFIGIFSSLGV